MCSNERGAGAANAAPPGPAAPPALLPYPLAALKQLNEAAAAAAAGAPSPAAPAPAAAHAAPPPPMAPNLLQPLDHYRLQLYNFAMAERLRFSQQLSQQAQHYPAPLPLYPGYPPYGPRLAFSMSLFHHRALQPEEPKPQHSYIGLIAMAILSSPDHKLVLSDIYQYILDNYPYFRTRGPGWRNSIRHNLSLNDCFIKAGRSANGKGHYWAIHPANIEDFKKGDFRRRKAQRKVRKHMGLAVDEEGNESPSPPPVAASPPSPLPGAPGLCWRPAPAALAHAPSAASAFPALHCGAVARKRQFDVASLLAPDDDEEAFGGRKASRRPALGLPPPPPPPPPAPTPSSEEGDDAADEDIDVVTSDQEAESGRAKGGPWEAPPPRSPPPPPGPPPPAPWPAAPAFQQQQQQQPYAFEHELVSRYYEQLAQHQQQQRRLAQQQMQQAQQAQQQQMSPGCSLSPAPARSPFAPDAPAAAAAAAAADA